MKYLNDWKESVKCQIGISAGDKNKMTLSKETLEGIEITSLCEILLCILCILHQSFVEMTRYLLSNTEGLFLLSDRISQDPLENYFGNQRARGGRNEHPDLKQCLTNAAALRVQKSIALDPVRGNCRQKRHNQENLIIDSTPLPKHKRATK